MPYTTADLCALDAAYAGGNQYVRTADGRMITKFTVDEYIKLRNLMLADISVTAVAPIRMVQVYTDSGW